MHLNMAGYKWLWYDGYGRLTLGLTQALLRAGHDVYPLEIDTIGKPAWFLQAQGLRFDRITVQLCPPDMMRHLPGRAAAFTMHESLRLPKGWAESVNEKNQWLIVPSPWLVELFSEGGVKLPISVVPGGIDPDECARVAPGQNRPFTFMALADRGNRKGWDKVWTAFYKAFDWQNRDVRLILKCRPGSLPHLDYSYGRDPRFVVWRADLEHIADIYAQADCFMFPTRCEGYGMPPREAAACGVPTMVTRFAGTADDCDLWAVPLEHFRLVESNMEGCGGAWADPDLDEIIWRMQDIYQNREAYRARAEAAAEWLRAHATYAHAAQTLVAALAEFTGGPLELREVRPIIFERSLPALQRRNGNHKKEKVAVP